MTLRWCAIGIAIAIILASGLLEVYILYRLDDWKEIGDFIVLLGIAPILSITIIVSFVLIGSFKQTGNAETSPLNILQADRSLLGGQV